MIGKDESQEDVVFIVKDRRKFNSDGSLREGVEITKEEKEEPKIIIEEPKEESFAEEVAEIEPLEEEDNLEEEIPGIDNPASFGNFLMSLVSQAAAALGAMPHPVTGQRSLDLDVGKHWIDVLLMLKEKTKGNLHPKEAQLFEGMLSDLQMQYVQMVRMTEERLKQQAAQKFSGKDVFGAK